MNAQRIARITPTVPTGTSTEGRRAAHAPPDAQTSQQAKHFRAMLSKSIATEARRRQVRQGR